MILKFPFLFNVILTLLLAATASFGDFCVNYFTVHLHKALCDNATHAAVAVISWLIVYVCHKYKNINQMCVEIIICGMVASAIDLDHFFIARSTSLKVFVLYFTYCTLNLSKRTFFRLQWILKTDHHCIALQFQYCFVWVCIC